MLRPAIFLRSILAKLFEILRLHLPSVHAYGDYIQLYVSFILSDSVNKLEVVTALENWILDVCLDETGYAVVKW